MRPLRTCPDWSNRGYGERSPVHEVVSFTEAASPITVHSDNDSASVDAPSLQRPITPGLSTLFRLEEVRSISTSSTESDRARDSSVSQPLLGTASADDLIRLAKDHAPRNTRSMDTKHRRADAYRAGCSLKPVRCNQASRSLRALATARVEIRQCSRHYGLFH